MFDSIRRVKLYEQALKAMKTGKLDKRRTYVHDYNLDCYRKDKGYTLNGLHWGYPDGIVRAITGADPEGASCIDYATWVTPETKKRCGDNSRFSIVPFGEIRAVIEKGIRQKLAKARIAAELEEYALSQWRKALAKRFPKYCDVALRIESSDPSKLDIIAIDPTRFATMGMGDFLDTIKKGDVSIGKSALKVMQSIPARSGLMAVEVFNGPIVAGMFGAPEVRGIPITNISIQPGALTELVALSRIED